MNHAIKIIAMLVAHTLLESVVMEPLQRALFLIILHEMLDATLHH